MSTVTRKLVAKELYVNRWLIIGSAVAGVVSVLIAAGGRVAFNVGALTWMTSVIAHGVMLAIYGVMNERKEHSLLFVLSLPLSIGDYVRAKQVGLALCFFVPWLISSIAAVVLVLAHPDVPDGLLPFLVLLCVFLLANFSLVLCGSLLARTETMVSAVVIVTNMAVTVFIFIIGGLPEIQKNMNGAVPVWNSTVLTVLAFELGTLVLAFLLPLFIAARRRDFA
jgi:ABC-2 type transport system permease protein